MPFARKVCDGPVVMWRWSDGTSAGLAEILCDTTLSTETTTDDVWLAL